MSRAETCVTLTPGIDRSSSAKFADGADSIACDDDAHRRGCVDELFLRLRRADDHRFLERRRLLRLLFGRLLVGGPAAPEAWPAAAGWRRRSPEGVCAAAGSKPHTPAVSATASPDNTARCNDEHDFIRTPKLGRLEPPVLGSERQRADPTARVGPRRAWIKSMGARVPQRRRFKQQLLSSDGQRPPRDIIQKRPSSASRARALPGRVGRLADDRPADHLRIAQLGVTIEGSASSPASRLQSELDARGIPFQHRSVVIGRVVLPRWGPGGGHPRSTSPTPGWPSSNGRRCWKSRGAPPSGA